MTSKCRARIAARIALLAMLVHAATAQGKSINDSQQRLWEPGSTLRICVAPPPSQWQASLESWTDLIPEVVDAWRGAGANLTLTLAGECADSCEQPHQIRIGYVPGGPSTTLRGTEALGHVGPGKGCPTVLISFNQLKKLGNDEGRWLLSHEIGHALGLVHEHQRAGCTVSLRAQRALAGLPAEPVTTLPADVARNFVPVEPRLLPDIGFQADSVMTYAFPPTLHAELSRDPALNVALTACLAERPVTKLSEHDRAVLRAAYPATPNGGQPRPAK